MISALANGGDGNYTYTWSPIGATGADQTVTPAATTTYTVSVEDGCETPAATADVTITVSPIPVVTFTADTLEGCMPVEVIFTEGAVPQGSTCLWTFGDGGASTDCGPTSYTFENEGCWDVSLLISTPDGCQNTFSQQDYICVYGYPEPGFSFGPQPTTVTIDNDRFHQ